MQRVTINWRTMECIPKDGDEFLVVFADSDRMLVVRYAEPDIDPEYCLYGDAARYKLSAFRAWCSPSPPSCQLEPTP